MSAAEVLALDGDKVSSRRCHLKSGVFREQEHANGNLQEGVVQEGVLRVISLQ
jgi:hypothetical protein